ncbi:MAG TPA: hypothetical protein VN178_05810 [Rubrobacter sp.]|jgi:3-hydroxyisobutyrate dehydrogenase-like beta-hydroxyacid dehydrogenase|nr:hypothetical protein [Rubrobacter sp.]
MQRAGFIGLGAMGAAHRLYEEGSSLGGEDDSGVVRVFETTNEAGDSLRI